MNRMHLRTSRPTISASAIQIEQSLFQTVKSANVPCTLFAPLHYEEKYAYPLVVWLHGPGDDERQLQRVMPLISMRNYVAVGLRGPRTAGSNHQGFCWSQDDSDIFSAEQELFESLEMVTERFHIAQQRIFLAGYQCGGTMAFRLGMKYPKRFAGILSINGEFPTDRTPLLFLDQARKLPLFIAQGRDSTVYCVEKACKNLRLFHAAGMHVTLRQYPCGDKLHTQMLHDMDVWLMERVTGAVSSLDEATPPVLGDEH